MSVLRLTPERYAELQKRAKKRLETELGRAFPASGTQARSKYRNRATGGYASVKEARRAAELKLMQKAGTIRELREQVPFLLIPEQRGTSKIIERACHYVADFVYQEAEKIADDLGHTHIRWNDVVEDVKSEATKTAEYRIKKKLMLWVHGIRVTER